MFLILLVFACDSNNYSYNCNDLEESELTKFSLVDLNPTSSTYDETITIDSFSNTILLIYFTNKET